MERQPPQTEAMELDPFDSVIVLSTRMVYGNSSSGGTTGSSARSAGGRAWGGQGMGGQTSGEQAGKQGGGTVEQVGQQGSHRNKTKNQPAELH